MLGGWRRSSGDGSRERDEGWTYVGKCVPVHLRHALSTRPNVLSNYLYTGVLNPPIHRCAQSTYTQVCSIYTCIGVPYLPIHMCVLSTYTHLCSTYLYTGVLHLPVARFVLYTPTCTQVRSMWLYTCVFSLHLPVLYLQVWRPRNDGSNDYTLVGKTYFQPRELRFQEVTLQPSVYIHMQKGDVLGLYYHQLNPLAWSSVPCAYPAQRHLYRHQPDRWGPGVTLSFQRAAARTHACRHYSFTAVLGEGGVRGS